LSVANSIYNIFKLKIKLLQNIGGMEYLTVIRAQSYAKICRSD